MLRTNPQGLFDPMTHQVRCSLASSLAQCLHRSTNCVCSGALAEFELWFPLPFSLTDSSLSLSLSVYLCVLCIFSVSLSLSLTSFICSPTWSSRPPTTQPRSPRSSSAGTSCLVASAPLAPGSVGLGLLCPSARSTCPSAPTVPIRTSPCFGPSYPSRVPGSINSLHLSSALLDLEPLENLPPAFLFLELRGELGGTGPWVFSWSMDAFLWREMPILWRWVWEKASLLLEDDREASLPAWAVGTWDATVAGPRNTQL